MCVLHWKHHRERPAIYLCLFDVGSLSVPLFSEVKVFLQCTGFKPTSQHAQDPWTECWPLWGLLFIHEPYTIRSDMGLWAWSTLLWDSGIWPQGTHAEHQPFHLKRALRQQGRRNALNTECRNVTRCSENRLMSWPSEKKEKIQILFKSTSKMGLWGQRKWEQRMQNVLEDVAAALMRGWVSSTTKTFSPTETSPHTEIHLLDWEELGAEMVGGAWILDSEDLGSNPGSYMWPWASQSDSAFSILAVKRDKEFTRSLNCCAALMK